MELYLLNEKLQRYKPIKIYKSLTWNTYFSKEGNFTLEAPINLFPYVVYNDKRDVFLENTDDVNIGLIESAEKKVSEEGEAVLSIKGRLCVALLDRRVSPNEVEYEDKQPKDIVNNIMLANFISPTNIYRKIDIIEYVNLNQPDLSITDYLLKRGTDGLQALKDIAKIAACGFYMGLNKTENRLALNIYIGTDRTLSQSAVTPFVIEQARNTAIYIDYFLDRTKEKTFAEIDKENKAKTVYPKKDSPTNSGLRRKETYFDFSSISATITKADGSQVVIKPKYYENMIQNEAKTHMDKLVRSEYLDSKINNQISDEFKKTLYLGDKITIKDNQLGFIMDTYITGATETYSKNGYEVLLQIGSNTLDEEVGI